MSDEKARFLPFNAVNEFLLSDYRLKLIQTVLSESDQLSEERRVSINRLVKRLVKVPGFRNSALAPTSVKARASISAFERSAEFAANILAGWVELKPELARKVHDLLTGRGWQLLPLDADRTKLPGFLTRWPQAETFDVLNEAYQKAYPQDGEHEYDINLMIAWLWGRLPVELVESAPADPE
jgi:hypothetical protein